MTIRNRELSQFGSFIYVENSTQEIGITTGSFPYVGIGTTNPRYKLDIDGDLNFSGILRKNGDPFVGWSTAGVSGDNIYYADGDVGIGTTNPQYKLDVVGNANISGIVSASQYYLGGTELVDAVLQHWDSDGTNIYQETGNIGIGTTNPTQKLYVVGNIEATGTITGSNISADGITLSGGINLTSDVVTASRFISTVSSGTSPFTVTSQTLVTNLNADYLRGGVPGSNINSYDIVTNAGSQTLSNKTINLSSNTLTGTLAQFNTALSNDDFVGIAATQTLTNKTLTTPIISSISNSGTQTIPTGTGTLVSSNSVGVVTTGMISDGTVVNDDISASAAIAISKLAASTISGVSLGNNLSNLTAGSYITYNSGTTYNGSAAITISANGSSANTGSTLVARDASGNFTAGTITAAAYDATTTDAYRVGGTTVINSSRNLINIGTITANYLSINAQGGAEGGEMVLARPVSSTSLAGNVIIDVNGNTLRIFEGAGSFRGAILDITGCASQSVLLHSSNYNSFAPTLGGVGASGTWNITSNYANNLTQGFNTNWNTDFTQAPAGSTILRGDTSTGSATGGPGGTWWFQQNMRHNNGSNFWGTQVAWGWEDNALELRQRNISNGVFGGWARYWNSNNFVIEKGSNANGHYAKFPDGTVIYSVRKIETRSAPGVVVTGVTWPVTLSSSPQDFGSSIPGINSTVPNSVLSITIADLSTTGGNVYVDRATSVGTAFFVMGHGRWY
jgi:hypothetical protein